MDAIIGRTEGHKAAAPQENAEEKKLFEVSWAEYYGREPLNGIINEFDFRRLIYATKASTLPSLKAGLDAFEQHQIDQRVLQAENMAEAAGIELDNSAGLDPRVLLFAIMRAETRPKGAEFYHDDMTDNRMFEEVLRMAGDVVSLNKFLESRKVGFQKPASKLAEKGYRIQNKYAAENLRLALETANRNTETNSKDEERSDGGK